MAEPFRGLQISRRGWLLAGIAAPLFTARGANNIDVTFDGDNLHVSSPDLHFLIGKPLDRLKQGATVHYNAHAVLFSDAFATPLRRADAQFAVSYDIWGEDKFTVAMTQPAPRSVRNVTAAAAEAWCFENVLIDASGLAPDRKFWLQLDLTVANTRNISSVLGPGINIYTVLIDVLSQKPETDDPRWTRQKGPMRLADLARTPGRGSRNE